MNASAAGKAAPEDHTRQAAYTLLQAVLRRRQTLDDALAALPMMAPRDRAAGHRLAAAVLRRLGSLDAVLEPHLRRAPPDEVRLILRLGAAQLLLLETPPHAAVATAVALARRLRLDAFAGLVNAVLRRVAEGGAAVLETLDGPRLDVPPWLWASWGGSARAIAEAHTREAPLDLSLRPGVTGPEGGALLPSGTLRFPAGTAPTALPGYAEGDFWVQDAAAALPARLLAAQPGEDVADLCAAPGGKTAQLAAAGAHVVAVDRDATRLVRLRENLQRLRLSADVVAADLRHWQSGETFDAILLDAPCSATGTIRRHPDLPFLKRASDIPAMAAQQAELIAAAASKLRPGGRMIYAVCSLQPEEGEALILPAAAAAGLRLDPFTAEELDFLPEAHTSQGWLRTHSGMWADRGGMDGFFAARLRRI